MVEDFVERYRQRYETWRHLDRTRYQVVQLTIAFVGAIGLMSKIDAGAFPSWLIVIIGLVFYLLGKVLAKVNDAIVENGKALREFGESIGDSRIPDTSARTKSIFYYLEVSLVVVGMLIAAWGCFLLFPWRP